MGWASLENHAHAQLSQTPGLGGLGLLASVWNREQDEPARLPWEQVQAMLAGGVTAEVGCWWWNVPDPEGPCTAWPGWAGSWGHGLIF